MASLLLLQYATFAVWPAWRHHNPAQHFIWWITAVGVGAAFLVELAAAPVSRPAGPPRAPVSPRAAVILTAIGMASNVMQSSTDGQVFGGQEAPPSRLSTLLTPLHPWALLGCACLIVCWRAGQLSRRRLLLLLALATLTEFWYAIAVLGRSAPLMSFSLAVVAGCVLAGAIPARTLLVAVLLSIVAWPTIVGWRNGTRARAMGVSTSTYQQYNSTGRLREDLLLASAARTPVPLHVGQPSLVQTVRYGLLPRALDSGRDSLYTTRGLSVAFGSTDTSSYTLTILGTTRALAGTPGMVGLMAAAAAAVRLLRARETPLRLALVMTIVRAVVWIESTYPDGIAGTLQAAVSMAAALGAYRLWCGRAARRADAAGAANGARPARLLVQGRQA